MRELDICENVRFLGKLEAVEEVLSVADLFLMPSEKKASVWPRSKQWPARSTRNIHQHRGLARSLNVQGVTGFMSNVADAEDMTRKALLVLDKDNLPTFKENALKRAKEFDISRILPIYESYYQKILDKTAVKTPA